MILYIFAFQQVVSCPLDASVQVFPASPCTSLAFNYQISTILHPICPRLSFHMTWPNYPSLPWIRLATYLPRPTATPALILDDRTGLIES